MSLIPVYAVTGFLDAGKTSFIQQQMMKKEMRKLNVLLIQFEQGEVNFSQTAANSPLRVIRPYKAREGWDAEEIAFTILSALGEDEPDLIWVEWNGMLPFEKLYRLFVQTDLRDCCKLEKSVHIADAKTEETWLGRTGQALPEQIVNSDMAVINRAETEEIFKDTRRLLKSVNPRVKVFSELDERKFTRSLYQKKRNAIGILCVSIFTFGLGYLLLQFFTGWNSGPLNQVITVFLGTMLQAVPFLLIGVLLSSFLQIFVPDTFIQKYFPKNMALGMLMAVVAGFFLPVCDCATIPVFRGLQKKGVPLPAAVTFMIVAPVINPVVMLSTYYAFGSMEVVAGRVILGIVCAVIIGLTFSFAASKETVLKGGANYFVCSCGCYEGLESAVTLKDKLILFLRHSQTEFFDVAKYMTVGCFVASLFQVGQSKTVFSSEGGLFVSLFIMMAAAFLLSLCSSSDAVVARSFASKFPMGAVMGFMVFGPMVDLKNIIMLSQSCKKSFILRLSLTAFAVCFAVIFLVSIFGLTTILGGV